jgi:hypothetical protein
MSKKNVITKKSALSAPMPTKPPLNKLRRRAKRAARFARAGSRLAKRDFELAKGSLVKLLRELKQESQSQKAAAGG